MAAQLKNTLLFVNLAPGAVVVLPHDLNNGVRALAPDIIFIPSADLLATSDDVAVTLTNQGPSSLSGAILVEAWHSIERAFGGVQNTDLPVKPYIVVSVEGSGQLPQPPFVPTEILIFVRTAGSDITGKGTAALPFRTLAHAIRTVPTVRPAGVTYRINYSGTTGISGAGGFIEVLPDDYALPAFKGSETLAADVGNPFFTFIGGIALEADLLPYPFVNPADATIAAIDGVLTTDPVTGFRIFTLNVARPSWVGLAGKQVVSANPGQNCVIYENPSTSVIILNQTAVTFPLTISEPSAVLSGAVGGSFLSPHGCLNVFYADSVSISGTRIINTVPGNSGLVTDGPGSFIAQNCELDATSILTTGEGRFVRNWVTTFYDSHGQFNPFLCFFDAADLSFLAAAPTVGNIRFSVFDGCTPIEAHATGPGLLQPATTDFLNLDRVLVRNGSSDGLRFWGSKGRLNRVDVYGCVGNGIFASDPGLLQMNMVRTTGAPNGGVGVRVVDGAFVKADAATSAAGTPPTGAGGDMQVGDGAARTWADFLSGASGRPALNEYDITAVAGAGGTFSDAAAAAAYVTGSGSRLFQ